MEATKRMAVLVGCNYPNTKYELHGCINDVMAMRETLMNRFSFEESNIQVLTDEPGSLLMPTGANIKRSLGRMVGKAKSGDVLFFHYSGHGTRVPSMKHGNLSRQDEAIVPCDFNLITDIDFRRLVNRLPKGTSFTMISDSCHSGGLIDKEKEQIGPSTIINDEKLELRYTPDAAKAKTIPFQSILQHLSLHTNINTTDIGTHLLEYFGADASLKFQLDSRELDTIDSLKPDAGILLSGCQANESSADMNPDNAAGKAYGAFSNAIENVLKENPAALSNKQVVVMARGMLKKQGLGQQHPCLYCSDENAEAMFLCQNP
ncbi:metacaspase-9 [Cucurbita moschata]|uniref:Metacaspase-9 n=1 Tax=Cucurbita moschata TaxID=3662 RepID=A0A6J1GEC0_CUCMO|nr:metacaspase-9 [Cucurbita moschata]